MTTRSQDSIDSKKDAPAPAEPAEAAEVDETAEVVDDSGGEEDDSEVEEEDDSEVERGGAEFDSDEGRPDDDFRAEWSASGRFSDRAGRERPLGDLASRLFRVGAEAVNQTTERLKEAGDVRPRDIMSGAASITARGREELAGLVAKEVRLYMEKFRIGEELRALMTDHSLEVHASVRLKPVADEPEDRSEADPEDVDPVDSE